MKIALYDKVKELAIQLEQDLEFYKQFPELECNKDEGILPRALFLEKGDPTGKGSIIVGLNPGAAKNNEKEFVKQNMSEIPILYNEKWYQFPYHNRLRNIMKQQLGYTGDILWTELVKCQSKEKSKISLQAIRKEFKQHLQHEIDAVPTTWLIVGIGNKAYELLAKLYPDRTVLGLHHPTGSFSFNKLFSEKDRLDERIKHQLISFLEKDNGECKFLKYRKGQFILE